MGSMCPRGSNLRDNGRTITPKQQTLRSKEFGECFLGCPPTASGVRLPKSRKARITCIGPWGSRVDFRREFEMRSIGLHLPKSRRDEIYAHLRRPAPKSEEVAFCFAKFDASKGFEYQEHALIPV